MRSVALASLCLVLGACVGGGAMVAPSLAPDAPRVIELTDTPFHPQSEFQCGPAALATVLGASGVRTSPDELKPLVYLPARRGSLQVEMQSAPRQFGRLSYPVEPEFGAILAELAAQRPVLVLHNYGVPFLPRWHYAVVVGYDAQADRILLRSGTTARQEMGARTFMRAWDNGDRWALVLLKPGELPARADVNRYLETAASFERGATARDAKAAFDAATKRWPNEPVAWIGRGTAEYRQKAFEAAARDYATAVRLDGHNIGARNNLAMALLELGCPALARRQLEVLELATIADPLREAVEDTRGRLSKATAADPAPAVCGEIASAGG
jgi:hypothetical protein